MSNEAIPAPAVLLIGGSATGKSNFLVRAWLGLRKSGQVKLIGTPEDIEYVEQGASYLMRGQFVPRTSRDAPVQNFAATVELLEGECKGEVRQILLPDINGELWSKAVHTREIPEEWHRRMQSAHGAILFVRLSQPSFVEPLDWVTARELLGLDSSEPFDQYPTQVEICELLHFLRDTMLANNRHRKPRVALVITAWDALPADHGSPEDVVRKNMPMVSGLLEDQKGIEARVFGVSIVDGDLDADADAQRRCKEDLSPLGYSVITNAEGAAEKIRDVTLPIAWVLSAP